MNLHMLLQVGTATEAFIAHFAKEWLLARVDPLMADKVGDLVHIRQY